MNPVTSRDDQLAFANNLRSVADRDIAKIKQDTYNLGTHVPSNLGGLTGSEGIWRRSYVSPKVESMTRGLRAVAQSAALEGAMNNYLNQMKQKYNTAYKAAARRRSGGGGGSGGSGGIVGIVGNNGGNDLSGLIEWLTQSGHDVDESNVGNSSTSSGVTKGGNTVDVSFGDNKVGTGIGAAAGSALGTLVFPYLGPWGTAAGGALGGWLGSRWGQ